MSKHHPLVTAALAAGLLTAPIVAAGQVVDPVGPAGVTTRQDLQTAKEQLLRAQTALQDAQLQPGTANDGRIQSAQRQAQEAIAAIRRAMETPGWKELPDDRADAIDRSLAEAQEATSVLRGRTDGVVAGGRVTGLRCTA
ncbi:hypothetical protein [Azospirillum aestuarii]|uniref:hypothetical protein n=1 Tax=Azospirillum aestuarii TaxID=2802052 RepID=UPI0040552AA0